MLQLNALCRNILKASSAWTTYVSPIEVVQSAKILTPVSKNMNWPATWVSFLLGSSKRALSAMQKKCRELRILVLILVNADLLSS